MIDSFTKEYSFLSNFYMHPIEYLGLWYPSVEHAYQAAKTHNQDLKKSIAALSTPGKAKRAGKQLSLRSDWEEIKLTVMTVLVLIKFQDESLQRKLLRTEDEELVEGNYWGDPFWGVCKGKGENNLGKILMRVREQLRNERRDEKT